MNLRLIASLVALLTLVPAVRAEEEAQLPAARPRERTEEELAAQTVVVFNQNDIDSTALAGIYAEKRKIPAANLIPLKCSSREEITRDEYDLSIAEPLRKFFINRGFWKLKDEPDPAGRVKETKVRFVVLMRGIPLKIAQANDYPGDSTEGDPAVVYERNEAAVDSELAVLGLYAKQVSGPKPNFYYREQKTIGETDPEYPLLVCRMDAATPDTVRSMIDDSIAAEKEGLRGFVYVDAQGLQTGGLALGDQWLRDAARDAREHGLPVIMDNGLAVFPSGYPMRNCALYLGWYSEHVQGPFAQPGFKFPRGAVAYHIHSFSALSLRNPAQQWCAPLLSAGAVATLGNVYEPFLGVLPRPNVFSQRLREGFTFAEAAYASQQYLSWMTTFIGDPLYRPFANSAAGKPDTANEWDAYRAAVATWISKGRKEGEAEMEAAAQRLKSGIVYEAYGLLQMSGNDFAKASAAFSKASGYYTNPADRVRVVVHTATAIRAAKGVEPAIRFLDSQMKATPEEQQPILQILVRSMAYDQASAKLAEKKAKEDAKAGETESTQPKTTPKAPKEKKR